MTATMAPEGETRRAASTWRRRARTACVAGATLAILAVGGVASFGFGGRGDNQPAPRRTGPAATAEVTRQTLVEAVTMAGELSYGSATPITSAAAGTVTWLPAVGATVRRGGTLLRVDDKPVVLLYGTLPMYRPLTNGVTGADVRQFEQNLWALGYHGFTVDDRFSAYTKAAVKRWQRDLRISETGSVERGRVIYVAGQVRIDARLVRLGVGATGDVLSYTGSTRVVLVAADPAKAAWAVKGAKVTLSSTGGASMTGAVSGTVAGTATGSATGAPTGAATTASAAGEQGQVAAGQSKDGAGVEITISFTDQKALGSTDGTAVSVRHVTQQRKDVLTVPVNALLALAEGGYGVEVVTGDASRIVAVEVGLFAEGRVEVRGAGLAVGATVGVPE